MPQQDARLLPAFCAFARLAAVPQHGQLVVAPTTVRDSKGRMVDGLAPSDLILYDNNVLRPIQADMASYPISLVVAVESNANSKAVLDKLGSSGILFAQLLAAESGRDGAASFSDTVTKLADFTADPDDLTRELKQLKPDGGGAAVLDGLSQAPSTCYRIAGRGAAYRSDDLREPRPREHLKLPEVVQGRSGKRRSLLADLLATLTAFHRHQGQAQTGAWLGALAQPRRTGKTADA